MTLSPPQFRRVLAALLLALSAHAPSALAATPEDLLRAYPDVLAAIEGDTLIWRDGTRMPLDDSRPAKSPEDLLRAGSIIDQLHQPYPAGDPSPPAPDQDPGRIRNRALFDKMYGRCQDGQVEPRLVHIAWLPKNWGHTISVTSVNGVDQALSAISRELDDLPPGLQKYLHPIGGTYVCRKIADTGQTSMHAYGAAIDINVAASDYWFWRKPRGDLPAYANRIPPEIVAIFERHGFIWGGRWAHFDTMHFEYRPELVRYIP